MAVRAGIAVHGGAYPAGDAGQRLQPLQPLRDGEIHQVLEHRPGVGVDRGRRRNRRVVAE